MSIDFEKIVDSCSDVLFEMGGGKFSEFTANVLAECERKQFSADFMEKVMDACVLLARWGDAVIRMVDDEVEPSIYVPEVFYENAIIKVRPTAEELSGEFMMLGHRLTPFLFIREDQGMPVIKYGGKELHTKTVKLSVQQFYKYFSLLNMEERCNMMLSCSLGDKDEVLLGEVWDDDSVVEFSVYDMSEVFKNAKGQLISFQLCKDFESDLFYFSVLKTEENVVDFEAVHEFVEVMDFHLAEFNISHVGKSASEQLRSIVPNLPMKFIKNQPISFSQYSEMSKKFSLAHNGVGLTFYDKGKRLPDHIIDRNAQEEVERFRELLQGMLPEEFEDDDFLLDMNDDFENSLKPQVYTFKVAFDHNKRIYSKIDVHSESLWEDLHLAIQKAIGFENDHLYSFFLTGEGTKSIRKRMDAPEVACPLADPADYVTTRTRVGDIELNEKEKLYYLFDYGDEWWFELTVTDIKDGGEEEHYPAIKMVKGPLPEQYPDCEEWDFEDE